MTARSISHFFTLRHARRLVLFGFAVAFVVFFAQSCSRTDPPKPPPKPIQQDVFEIGPLTPIAIAKDKDLTKFLHADHNESKDKRLNCNYCHGVDANLQKIQKNPDNVKDANKPPFSGHNSCIACHLAEFTRTQSDSGGWSPMCNVCHKEIGIDQKDVNVMKEFPQRLSHNAIFTAEQHREHMKYSYPDGDPKFGGKKLECQSCHGVLGRPAPGVDFSAHVTCYACHQTSEPVPEIPNAKREIKPGSLATGRCDACHFDSQKPEELRPLIVRATGQLSYKYKFTHYAHDKLARCEECHNLDGTYANQVGVPRAKQHKIANKTAAGQGCFSCHNDKRAFGDETQTYCGRCHTPDQLRELTVLPEARIRSNPF
jgi:c(7)-type cytochrome triheme protein